MSIETGHKILIFSYATLQEGEIDEYSTKDNIQHI